jgi:hypothetical protein
MKSFLILVLIMLASTGLSAAIVQPSTVEEEIVLPVIKIEKQSLEQSTESLLVQKTADLPPCAAVQSEMLDTLQAKTVLIQQVKPPETKTAIIQ